MLINAITDIKPCLADMDRRRLQGKHFVYLMMDAEKGLYKIGISVNPYQRAQYGRYSSCRLQFFYELPSRTLAARMESILKGWTNYFGLADYDRSISGEGFRYGTSGEDMSEVRAQYARAFAMAMASASSVSAGSVQTENLSVDSVQTEIGMA